MLTGNQDEFGFGLYGFPWTRDPSYTKEIAEGKVYTLRLEPPESTLKQFRENKQECLTFLWINGNEIEELKAAK